MAEDLLAFSSDYMEGAHPNILKRLNETNMFHTAGYGCDEFSESARNLIKKACSCPKAQVQFLIGGTQTNAFAIDCLLKKWQGVIAADTGHVAVHEMEDHRDAVRNLFCSRNALHGGVRICYGFK